MLAALLLAALPQSNAAAYYFTDIGTRGMARGGAYIAGNRDLEQFVSHRRIERIGIVRSLKGDPSDPPIDLQ